MILGKHRFKNFSAFAMLSLLLSLLISGCNPEPDFIRIGIVGDQYGASDSVPPLPVMKQGVENLLNYHPDIMLHVGDMVESIHNIKTFDDYQTLFIQAAGIMESTGLPWLIALGDHDVVPPVYQPLSSDRTRENWFMSCAKNTSLPLDSLPYYSFTLKGYHFISLYSMENLHTDPRWGSIFLNNLSDAQLTWLKKDLEAHKSAKGIVILVHHPHWYVWSNWSRVHNVLKQYNVKAVIAGHYHYDQDDGEIDGIRYLVMGATGGYVKQCDAHSGGTSMVGIIDLDKKGIKNIQLFDIPGDSLLELTPRQSMDRIQAIEYMLDNLSWDIMRFSQSQNDTLRLISLANPIDLPIQLSIETNSSDFKVTHWFTDFPTASFIMLNPGERIGWANYSNIGQWGILPPLWEGVIQQNIFEKSRKIPMTISVSFTDNRTRVIHKKIVFTHEKGTHHE